ncbi:MAG: DUF285 domain-containing protein, partial [Lachnospiraceae bacterium]|nr:DUF285 domain-containing protein [Lachnospiraceae bacterium]
MSETELSSVTSLSGVFSSLSALTSVDMSKAKVSALTTMSSLFKSCTALEEVDMSGINAPGVTDMGGMFSGCTALTTVKLSEATLSGVSDISSLFRGCTALTSVDMSKAAFSGTVNMDKLFYNCEKLTSADLSDISAKASGMESMFEGCIKLTSADLSNITTGSASLAKMFYNCASLSSVGTNSTDSVNVSGFDTNAATDMSNMFYGCTVLTSANLGGFDMSNVENAESMLESAECLSEIYEPLNVKIEIALPDNGSWYIEGDESGEAVTLLPTELTATVKLYNSEAPAPDTDTDDTDDTDDEQGRIDAGTGLQAVAISDQTYTGSKLTPSVKVYDGDTLLTEKTDYTVSYKDNTNVGTATVTIKGKGSYTGTVTMTFNIVAASLADKDSVAVDDIAVLSNGKTQKISPTVTFNGKKLKNGTDYTMSKESESAVGTSVITLTGKGNFTGTRTFNFTIADKATAKLMSKASVSKIAAQDYTGSAIDPAVTVTYKGTTLTEGTDYTVEYSNNTDAGTGYVVVTGTGTTNYYGSKRVSFKINGTQIKNVTIGGVNDVSYTGSAIKLPLVLTDGSKTLTVGEDYTYTYSGNTNAGKATLTIVGMGGYSGTVKKTFKINAVAVSDSKVTADISAAAKYLKGGAVPDISLTFGGKTLVEGTDYTVSCKKNKTVGETASFVIKGKGNFTGSIDGTFKVEAKALNDTESPVTLLAPDVAVATKANKYQSKISLIDADGKALKAGTDYEVVSYTMNGGADVLGDTSQPALGDEITVTVSGKGAYEGGTLSAMYKIIDKTKDIAKAKIKIAAKEYTGSAVTLENGDFTTFTLGGTSLTLGTDYEIVSYTSNVKKGTASVTVRGINNYGGMKTVK